MKLSWGYKILFVYLFFITGIVFLVFKASSEKFDLVTKDYYNQELKYQQVINHAANASALSAPVKIEKSAMELKIIFPAEMKEKEKLVDFYLYCPADAKRDFRKSLTLKENEMTQPLPAGMSGLYEIKLSWTSDATNYYHEEKIFF
jgi:hypothetical protein